MWMLITPTSRPDAPYWRGRRGWAAIDAVAWPLVWIIATTQLIGRGRGGLVGAVVVAMACVAAHRRLCRAVYENQRYYFTTWRWGRAALFLLLIGWAVKWTLVLL